MELAEGAQQEASESAKVVEAGDTSGDGDGHDDDDVDDGDGAGDEEVVDAAGD